LNQLFAGANVEFAAVATSDDIAQSISEKAIDAVVIVPEPADGGTAGIIERVLSEPNAARRPVFLYLPASAALDEIEQWRQLAHEFELQPVESMAQLVAGLVRAADVPFSELAEPCQALLRGLDSTFQVLAGKKVMIVDDDMRNIFALSSTLERQDIVTVSAETGRDAINLLQAAPDVDIVLMDIMMPEMDGIDTMRAIRQISHFKGLPIIAVTAKAMKGDREKCIEAGAWDYLSKPVDPEQLLTVLRAWLTV
jgi:CheY-like chemotaxis protein